MKHPKSRAERRAVRETYIARRKFISQHIWYQTNLDRPPQEHDPDYIKNRPYKETEWGRYAKFNLNCGCKMCHWEKWNERRARRAALDRAITDNLQSFEEAY